MHGLTLGLGTLGATAGYIYAPNHKSALSLQFSYLPMPAQEYEINTNNYTDTTLLSTITLKGHLHPLPRQKWFHVAAGVAYSMSTINLELPEGTYQIGNTADVPASGTATVDFSDIQPYVGIGTGYTNKKKWHFFLDVGVNMQGEPTVETSISSTESGNAISDEDLEAERTAIFDHYSAYQFFPVIQLGVNYMF